MSNGKRTKRRADSNKYMILIKKRYQEGTQRNEASKRRSEKKS